MEPTKIIPDYKEGLKELQENLQQMLPEEALQVFDKDAGALEVTHRSILQIKPGEKAPDFRLSNATGDPVSLSELLRRGKVVLTFYRGTWCPYCNLQLNQYQQSLPEMQAAGAQLVAVSPQTPDESLNMQQKNELQFEVLSDPGNIVARKFTTIFRNGEAPVDAMTALGIDFDAFYADDSREIPVPAVFVIDRGRTVTFARSEGGDYRNRVEPREVLKALRV